MNAARLLFVAIGIALAIGVLLAAALRLFREDTVAVLQHVPDLAFYAIAAILLFFSVFMMLHTPASRRGERRVDLAEPVTRDASARPRPPPPPPRRPTAQQAPARQAAAQPRAPQPSARAAAPPAQAAQSAKAKRERRRAELEARLSVLQQRADALKVSFGLGRISSAGYTQSLKEIDEERTMLETELFRMEHA